MNKLEDIHTVPRLSLRQRRIVYCIQNKRKSFITGADIAQQFQITARTVRNDVAEINKQLTGCGILIASEKSKGYVLDIQSPEALEKLNEVEGVFISKEDRVRYIAFQLCLQDSPVNIYDLEDDMLSSYTTIEHDIQIIKQKYVLSGPRITLIKTKDSYAFENDERKKRSVLNLLFSEDWNYSTKGNIYYNYQFLEESVVNCIMQETDFWKDKNSISMEDSNIVVLTLAVAIMYYRIQTGHILKDDSSCFIQKKIIDECIVGELLDAIEKKLHCTFPLTERKELYHLVSYNYLITENMNVSNVSDFFSPETRELADAYIMKIFTTFQIDFRHDSEFYIMLLKYIRHLQYPYYYFTKVHQNGDFARMNLAIQFELAYLFQDLFFTHFGYYLGQNELVYLAFCIAGAFNRMDQKKKKVKFRTVILCHLNQYAAWALKYKLLSDFSSYLSIQDFLPVNMKSTYNFQKIDLVIMTVKKKLSDSVKPDRIYISPFFTSLDRDNLNTYIQKKHFDVLYKTSEVSSTKMLFESAFWHESILLSDTADIIRLLVNDFISADLVTSDFLEDILKRESLFTFVFQPNVVLLYSLVPSKKTTVSIATLKHRIKWNSFKIRTIVVVALKAEENPVLFRLMHELYTGNQDDPDTVKMLLTKEDWISYLQKHITDYR
jgi:lichenan operon transcriptional antiterminator